MATEKTFSVVGVSKHKGEYKVRFANDIMRIKVLAKNDHEDIRLTELTEAMTKLDAVNAIIDLPEFQDPEAQFVLTEFVSAVAGKVAKSTVGPAVHAHAQPADGEVVKPKRGRKPKTVEVPSEVADEVTDTATSEPIVEAEVVVDETEDEPF